MLPITDLALSTARGGAPALVLLHALGVSRREWIEVGITLGSEFRVVSIDTPGFGEAKEVNGYSVSEMAALFAETIAGLKLERFVLAGHSMTGKVAAVLAAQQLPGLEKLVLVTPSPLGPEPIAPEARTAMLAQTFPTYANAETYIRTNSAVPLRADVFERAVEDRLQSNPAAWRAWLESGSYEDWSERIKTVNLPTLVIAAERDASLGADVQKQLTLPHFHTAHMEVIPQSGHLVPMEQPQVLAGLLREFLGK